MVSAFPSNPMGAISGPKNLPGFRGQAMDGRRADTETPTWPFYDPNEAVGTYGNPRTDGTVIQWWNSTFTATLPEYQSAFGPIWAMHTPNGAFGTERGATDPNGIPLTNSVTDAYIRLTWPTARIATRWRGHNLNGDWGASRVPGVTRLDAWNGTAWITVDNGPSILNGTGDTGYRPIGASILATEHRLYMGNNAANTAQSLCFLDIKFA